MNRALKYIVMLLPVLACSSCAFIFYNYRGTLITEFFIKNSNKDTTVRLQAGKMINRIAFRQDFYSRYASPSFDSLYYYGPDYHYLRFKITETDTATKITFRYSGYHGFRSRPPRKPFITAVRDSLVKYFGARETVIREVSNEKKKRN